jgi:hypothetical protein
MKQKNHIGSNRMEITSKPHLPRLKKWRIMMSDFLTKTALLICMVCSFYSAAFADDLAYLKQTIKDCNNEECQKQLQEEAEQIFDRAGADFNDDFLLVGTEISLNHCRSLMEEILYHLKRIKPYYHYANVFYLKKLKRLKENRERHDRGEISADDFNRINRQIDEQYTHDISESQEFIDSKVARLHELCDNLNQNIESVYGNLRVQGRKLPESMRASLLSLQNEPIWREFASNGKEGKKIIKAIESASKNAGKGVVPCLRSMFSGFDPSAASWGTIFPPALVDKLVKKHPIG